MKLSTKVVGTKCWNGGYRRSGGSKWWRAGPLAGMLVFPAMFLLSSPQAFGSDSVQARAEVQRIKAQKGLSGPDRARVVHKYVQSLSDQQLKVLMEQLGAGRFLARLPEYPGQQGEMNRYSHPSTGAPERNARAYRNDPPQPRSDQYPPPSPQSRELSQAPRREDARKRHLSGDQRMATKGVSPQERQRADQAKNTRIDPRQEQQQRLASALRSPRDRERLTRAVANYLLNTTPPK